MTMMSNNVGNDGNSNGSNTNDKDGDDGDNNESEVNSNRQQQQRRQRRQQQWWDNDNAMVTRAIGRRRCDGDGRPATCRTVASTASPIRRNNQLIWTVWGEVEESEGQFWGDGRTYKGRGGGK